MNNDKSIEKGTVQWWIRTLEREISRLERTHTPRSEKAATKPCAHLLEQISDSLDAASFRPDEKGNSIVNITNIHTGTPLAVKLNPMLTISGNIELYRKKAKKARKTEAGEEMRAQDEGALLAGLRNALDKLSSLAHGTDRPGGSDADLEEAVSIAAEALRPRMPEITARIAGEDGQKQPSHPFRHLNVAGWDIYLGKSDEQNDELSIHFAAGADLWFHAAGCSGSHVIIRRPKNSPPPPQVVVECAASIAAWHSKAKNSPRAEVHFTEARFVHKRRGAPAGEVMLEKWKSLKVVPKSSEEIMRTGQAGDM